MPAGRRPADAMTPRVLVGCPLVPGGTVTLDPGPSHHLVRVLRLESGAPLQVFDGRGRRHAATILDPNREACTISVREAIDADTESPLRITLAQCLSGAERMDYTIEKAVELGVARIVPLASMRSKVRLDAERADRRLAHWQRVVEAACMQCGRDLLPEIEPARPLAQWLAAPGPQPAGTRIVLTPDARLRLSGVAVTADAGVTLLSGPEAGLDPSEVRAAIDAGFIGACLGPRILRTETAGVAALAVLQAHAGDL